MHPLDILEQIGALQDAVSPYKGRIALTEHETRSYLLPAHLSGNDLARLVEFFLPATLCDLLSVRVEVVPNSGTRLVIASANFVGFCCCGARENRLFVKVRPKVSTNRLLELAVVARRLPAWSPEVSVRPEEDSSLLEWTLRAFAAAVHTLVRTAGIRSTTPTAEAATVSQRADGGSHRPRPHCTLTTTSAPSSSQVGASVGIQPPFPPRVYRPPTSWSATW